MNWHPVALESEISAAGRKLFSVGELRLAVFLIENAWFAIDNHCPHRGGPIAAGSWDGHCITCPWHAAQFDLTTGQPLSLDCGPLRHLQVRIQDGFVEVDLDSIGSTDQKVGSSEGIYRFLVRYGMGGDVGLFGTIHSLTCRRGEQVIVQTQRGTEIGTILQTETVGDLPRGAIRGELLRVAEISDLAAVKIAQEAAAALIDVVADEIAVQQVAVQLIEADQTLDGQTAVFYFLGVDSAALGPIAVKLSQRLKKNIRFQKLTLDE